MHVCIYIYIIIYIHSIYYIWFAQWPFGRPAQMVQKNVLNLHLQVSNQKVSSDISVAAVDICSCCCVPRFDFSDTFYFLCIHIYLSTRRGPPLPSWFITCTPTYHCSMYMYLLCKNHSQPRNPPTSLSWGPSPSGLRHQQGLRFATNFGTQANNEFCFGPIGFLWYFCGINYCGISIGFPWYFFDTSVIFPWDFHNVSPQPPLGRWS